MVFSWEISDAGSSSPRQMRKLNPGLPHPLWMNKKWLSSLSFVNIILSIFFFQESNLVSPHWIWQSFQDNGESISQGEEYWLKKNPHEHSDNKTTGQTPLPCCFICNSCGTWNLHGFQAMKKLIWRCEILAGKKQFEGVMKCSRNGRWNLNTSGPALSSDTTAVVYRKLWWSHHSVC